jgi:hypothetical protein
LETEAAEVAIRRVREAAYPLIFRLFGDEIPRGKERKLILTRLGQDLGGLKRPWVIDCDPRGAIRARVPTGNRAQRPNDGSKSAWH